MAGGMQPVGPKPFTFDPGVIAPEVLRAMWLLLMGQVPAPLGHRLETVARTVGLAGLLTALLTPGRSQDKLAEALDAACVKAERHQDTYRRAGSDFCIAALSGGFLQSPTNGQKFPPGVGPMPRT